MARNEPILVASPALSVICLTLQPNSSSEAASDPSRLLKLAMQMVERRELSYGYLVAERAD